MDKVEIGQAVDAGVTANIYIEQLQVFNLRNVSSKDMEFKSCSVLWL